MLSVLFAAALLPSLAGTASATRARQRITLAELAKRPPPQRGRVQMVLRRWGVELKLGRQTLALKGDGSGESGPLFHLNGRWIQKGSLWVTLSPKRLESIAGQLMREAQGTEDAWTRGGVAAVLTKMGFPLEDLEQAGLDVNANGAVRKAWEQLSGFPNH